MGIGSITGFLPPAIYRICQNSVKMTGFLPNACTLIAQINTLIAGNCTLMKWHGGEFFYGVTL